MDGIILVHKPKNLTSHDVVKKVRKILGIKKVGHFGSLDPLATGLLIVAAGKATRLFPFFLKAAKTYTGQTRLGYSTDTYDSLGKPTSIEIKEYPDKEKILEIIKKLRGKILQVPPPFSAKKQQGKPLYVLARNNKKVNLKPNWVTIYSFQMKKYMPPFIDFKVRCSSGTYVRSLAHDMGTILGCGAHLSQLVRTGFGNFSLEESLTLQELEKLKEKEKIKDFLLPLESLLPEYPKIILKEAGADLVKDGNMIFPENIKKIFPDNNLAWSRAAEKETIFKMFNSKGKLLAFARKVPEKNCLHPFLVIDSNDI